MKTNKLVLALTFALAAASVFADAPATNAAPAGAKKPRIPARQTNAYKKRYGGDLIQPGSMKGRIAFFDAVGVEKEMDAVLRMLKSTVHLDCKTVKPTTKPEIANASKLIVGAEASVGIFIVERDDFPMLLAAPQNRYSFVNIKPLRAGAPEPDVFAARVRKMLWRAFAFTCGGGTSETPGCVMNACTTVEDVDALVTEMISPEGGAAIMNTLKKLGVTPYREVSYLVACREGWAPAPTNDFQKAIMERVKNPQKSFKEDFPELLKQKK